MKLTHPAVTAFGITMLFMLPIVTPVVESSHKAIYHLAGQTSTILYPALIYIGLLWLLGTALLTLGQRPGRMRLVLWTTLIGTLPWALLKIVAILLSWQEPHRLSLVLLLASLVEVTVFLVCWKPSFQPIFDHVQKLTATILGLLAFSGLLIFIQFGWFIWQTRSMNASMPLHHCPAASDAGSEASLRPRVIWLILDELSYRQVYEHRSPELELPAFDRLASQSTVFTHVQPVGDMTEYVVPSLMSGIPADDIVASTDGRQLSLHDPNSDRLQAFDPHQTVFQDALSRHYNTAAAGWFNPYCRILSQVLDQCFWTNHDPVMGGMSTNQTILGNLLVPAASLWKFGLRFFSFHEHAGYRDAAAAQAHIQDYRDLSVAADTMLDDSSADLLFLHMPIPHPLGIYNRHTGQLTTGPSTYIDNLALADVYVAHLRSQLEKRGEWDSTTVLIMGDHSWRTATLWAAGPAWSVEEQNASDGGQFDDRPAYILKLPHQHQPARIDTPYTALRTRKLLDALMEQRIHSPLDLSVWVEDTSSPATDSGAQ